MQPAEGRDDLVSLQCNSLAVPIRDDDVRELERLLREGGFVDVASKLDHALTMETRSSARSRLSRSRATAGRSSRSATTSSSSSAARTAAIACARERPARVAEEARHEAEPPRRVDRSHSAFRLSCSEEGERRMDVVETLRYQDAGNRATRTGDASSRLTPRCRSRRPRSSGRLPAPAWSN